MSVHSASLYFYCLYSLSFPDYLSACPLSISSFEKIWENANIRWVLENIFWNTCWKLWRMLEILRTFLKYFEIILWNCLEYFHEIWKLKKCRKSKFWINSGKIMEKHRGNFKLLILQKLRRILKMFLLSFSEIVKKSGEYFVQIFKHSKRKFCDIFVSKKLYEKHEIILRKFWNNLEKLSIKSKFIRNSSFVPNRASLLRVQIANYLSLVYIRATARAIHEETIFVDASNGRLPIYTQKW